MAAQRRTRPAAGRPGRRSSRPQAGAARAAVARRVRGDRPATAGPHRRDAGGRGLRLGRRRGPGRRRARDGAQGRTQGSDHRAHARLPGPRPAARRRVGRPGWRPQTVRSGLRQLGCLPGELRKHRPADRGRGARPPTRRTGRRTRARRSAVRPRSSRPPNMPAQRRAGCCPVRPPADVESAQLLAELRQTVESLGGAMQGRDAEPLLAKRRELERQITAHRWSLAGTGDVQPVAPVAADQRPTRRERHDDGRPGRGPGPAARRRRRRRPACDCMRWARPPRPSSRCGGCGPTWTCCRARTWSDAMRAAVRGSFEASMARAGRDPARAVGRRRQAAGHHLGRPVRPPAVGRPAVAAWRPRRCRAVRDRLAGRGGADRVHRRRRDRAGRARPRARRPRGARHPGRVARIGRAHRGGRRPRRHRDRDGQGTHRAHRRARRPPDREPAVLVAATGRRTAVRPRTGPDRAHARARGPVGVRARVWPPSVPATRRSG